MSVCIYSGLSERDGATFSGAEHVFPAGIGGQAVLPIGTVSDQANAAFSPLELDFMRNSLIALPRQMLGPGKRGSLRPDKATESNIHLMYQVEFGDRPQLGYVSLGSPYVITQIILPQAGEYGITLPVDEGADYSAQAKAFAELIRKWDGTATRIISEALEVVILGCHRGQWYIASKDEASGQRALDFAALLRRGELTQDRQEASQSHVRVHQGLKFNINSYFRVCAKIAVNTICRQKGIAFVMHESFRPIKEWILHGSENTFAHLLDPAAEMDKGLTRFLGGAFPSDSHKVIFTHIPIGLIALVSFYGGDITTIVRLCPDLHEDVFGGLICDWRNRREISIPEFLQSFA